MATNPVAIRKRPICFPSSIICFACSFPDRRVTSGLPVTHAEQSTIHERGLLMRPGALPLFQQTLLDIFIPPIGALVSRLLAGGWASGVQGGNVSNKTKRRQSVEFWVLLGFVYMVMFGITIYGCST
jgi:hypothetical protein